MTPIGSKLARELERGEKHFCLNDEVMANIELARQELALLQECVPVLRRLAKWNIYKNLTTKSPGRKRTFEEWQRLGWKLWPRNDAARLVKKFEALEAALGETR